MKFGSLDKKMLILVLVGTMGMAANFVLGGIVQHLERARSETLFQKLATERFSTIQSRIVSSAEALRLVGIYLGVNGHSNINRDAFQSFVAPTIANIPYFQAVEWVPRVTAAQRAAVEHEQQVAGTADFAIQEEDSKGKLVKAGQRDEYFPATLAEPLDPNRKSLGFDLASNPAALEALRQARDTGSPTISTRVTLIEDPANKNSMLMFVPVYSRPVTKLEERQANLLGFAVGIFRIGDFVTSPDELAANSDTFRQVEIHLFDRSGNNGEFQIFPFSHAVASQSLTSGGYSLSRTIPFGGRTWLIAATPMAPFQKMHLSWLAFLTFMAGVAATAVVLLYLKARLERAEEIDLSVRAMAAVSRRLAEAQKLAQLGSMEHSPRSDRWAIGTEAAKMMGLNERQTSLPLLDLLLHVHPDDRAGLYETLSANPSEGARIDLEFRIVGHDHERLVHALGISTEFQGSKEHGLLVTLQDITARKAAEQDYTKLKSRMAESSRFEALGTLAGGIAHEINTPAQFIGDNLTFLQTSISALLAVAKAAEKERGLWVPAALKGINLAYLSTELPKAVAEAMDGVSRIGRIVQAIKEYTNPGATKPAPFDLNHAIEVAVTVTSNQWKHVADLTLELEPNLPKINAIEGEINQVMLSTILNATQAISELGKNIVGRIIIKTRSLGDRVEYSITDPGASVSKAHQGKMFEVLHSVKSSGLGIGQGLEVVEAIIRRHGGTVEVDSEEGRGACLRITLPINNPGLPRSGTRAA